MHANPLDYLAHLKEDWKVRASMVYCQPDGEMLRRAKQYGTEHHDMRGNPWWEFKDHQDNQATVLCQEVRYMGTATGAAVEPVEPSGQLQLL